MSESPPDSVLQASYELNRHVPAMRDGFEVHTSYGSFSVSAEEVRRNPIFVNAVESLLQWRLHLAAQRERARKEGES